MTERATYFPEEAAERAGMSRSAFYEAIRRGEVPSIRIGRRILIPRKKFDAMLDGEAA